MIVRCRANRYNLREQGAELIYVSFLAKEDYEELKMMKRKEIGRVSLRAQMVLLSAKHWAVPRIADLFEISPATVRFWLRKFEKEGPKGLYDENRSGRPSKEGQEKDPALVEGS